MYGELTPGSSREILARTEALKRGHHGDKQGPGSVLWQRLEPSTAGPEVCGTRYAGRARVREAFARVFAIFPDATFSDARHFVAGNRGVSEWIFTGTTTGGKKVEVNGCDIFTFRNGKIAVKSSYFKTRTT